MSQTTTRVGITPDHGSFGQPRSLANLFGVELWERFSFYGMQGILLLYLYFSAADGGLGISKDSAVSIVGAYGGAVYLATILGGSPSSAIPTTRWATSASSVVSPWCWAGSSPSSLR